MWRSTPIRSPWGDFYNVMDYLRTLREHAHDRTEEEVDPRGPDSAPDEPDEAVLKAPGVGLRHLGVWCGNRALREPRKYAKFAADHGFDEGHIIVNDFSKDRDKRPFTLRSTSRILALASAMREVGMEPHLMTWLMPHREHLKEAREKLGDVATRTGAASVVFDLEEPWTQARRPMDYKEAGVVAQELFRDFPCRLGLTGIRYASVKKLGPMAWVEDRIVQAYSTKTSKAPPTTTPQKGIDQWEDRFGPPITLGLAAYRQSGIKKPQGGYYSKYAAMLAAAEAAAKIADRAIYWVIDAIMADKEIARAMAAISDRYSPGPGVPQAPGVGSGLLA